MRPLGEATPLAASPGGGTQAANDEAGFLTWVIALGGDIYRVGARQGATPPSTPSPRSRLWTGLLWPRDRHTYIRPVAAPLPATTQGALARTPPSEPRHPPRQPQGPGGALGASGAHAPRRLAPSPRPFSLIPPSPRRLPSVHLLLPTGECSGPTETGAPSPPSPFPYARGGRPGPRSPSEPTPTTRPPWLTALPAGRSACHAMPCWMDGSAAQVHAASPAARLPSDCHFAAPPRDSTPAHHAPAQSLPSCHAIPSTASTVEDHSHADSPTLTGLESCAQAFRGPNSILRGAHKCTQGGPPPASQPSPPLPSLAVNWREQEPCHLGAQARPPPIPIRGPGWATPPPAKSSAPLQCCQLAKGRAH